MQDGHTKQPFRAVAQENVRSIPVGHAYDVSEEQNAAGAAKASVDPQLGSGDYSTGDS
jgi:hypothetical protein